MSIIRKIIIKSWLLYFTSATMVLVFILSLGNILSNLLRANSHFSEVFMSLMYEMPTFLVKIFPVSCLIASLFALNQLKNRNELTAMFAAGFSRRKFIFTIATLGTFIGIILFYINSYLVPYAKHKSFQKTETVQNSKVSVNAINSGRVWFKGKTYFVSYSNFDSTKNVLNNLQLYYYDKNFVTTEEVKAKQARYVKDNEWMLFNFVHITNLNNKTFPNIQEKPQMLWEIDEDIQDFRKINSDISTLSIWKLYDYIQVLKSNGLNANEYNVSFLDKFSSGLTCLVLSLLSAVAVFNPNRRNSSFGLNVSFVLGFTFLYWFIYSYFITLGQGSRVVPVVATFGVPFVFIVYLFFFFIYHRKLR